MCVLILLLFGFWLQSTEVGLIGVDGAFVVNHVELVLENVLEAVRDQRQVLAGNNAQEKCGKVRSVTHTHVRVR